MRTTVAIEDHLLDAARRRARNLDLTLGQLIERSLRAELAGPTRPPSGPPIPVFSGGTGPRAGIDLSSNRALAEVLDAGLPPGKLR